MTLDNDAGKDLIDLYIDELGRLPTFSAEEQKKLARRMRDTKASADDRNAAREELIRANLRFAFMVAKKYQNRGLPLEDLISEANVGLCRAADKYDPGVGVNFISYAVWWIRQALFSAITTKGRAVRLPLNRAGDLSRIAKAQAALRDVLGREPTPEEVARVANLPADLVTDLTGLMHAERSLDEPVSGRPGDEGRPLATVLKADMAERPDALGELEDQSRREALLRALDTLGERDRKVLVLYYGLETGEPMTLNAIADMLGITRERVRQLRDRALAKVRESVAAEVLRQEWAA